MPLMLLAAERASALSRAALTYREVGATAGPMPLGYHHLECGVTIGTGADTFVGAANALLSWQVHLRAGVKVCASSPRVERDGVVMLRAGAGPIGINAPCRVVYVVDEPVRQGFAYGTLPGHPESGEEVFLVEHHDDDSVHFRIAAFARPATAVAKAAGPLGRLVQRRLVSRYLAALTG